MGWLQFSLFSFSLLLMVWVSWDESACASSRRTAIHSVAFRLLCWKRSIKGVERRREVYWRWSWDFRNSGGRWEGGWVGG